MTQTAPHILVTGGGRGIGAALCVDALGRGWRVSTTLRSGAAPAGVTAHPLDLRDVAALAALSQAVGPVDILINNAGIMGPRESALDLVDYAGFAEVLAVNTLAPLAVSQALLPNLRAAGCGGRAYPVDLQSDVGHGASQFQQHRL